jgi:selenocysteine lyase/cysteine desulfurase
MSDKSELVELVRSSVIGRDQVLEGPFGQKLLVYADYTASGRCLAFIEDYLRTQVMPFYANTHTMMSGTGRQTTSLREEAREIIAQAVGASDDDVVIFSGSGATAGIHQLIEVLGLRSNSAFFGESSVVAAKRPVVFIGPYEHHSNEVSWRESIADVVVIDEDENGRVDIEFLERELTKYRDRPLKIGSFSAASNVTGIGSDTRAIAALLHRYGALSFWDFAAAGPYVKIEMNMNDELDDGALVYKDAVFLSPHKFVGGPGTTGILVAKKHLFEGCKPSYPGGGTVDYVSRTEHVFSANIVEREEAGTPAILASIQAGLVFQLKEAVGIEEIQRLEHHFIRTAIERWRANSSIHILGNHDRWRLSIVSFMIRGPNQKFLHHHFVVALLNDLFGIQARGGWQCAGPYGHRLLNIDLTKSEAYKREVQRGCRGVKPGWTRLNFNYFISDTSFEYIARAVELVAEYGWRMMPAYRFDPESGRWQHRAGGAEPSTRLTDITYEKGQMSFPLTNARADEAVLAEQLIAAEEVLTSYQVVEGQVIESYALNQDYEELRWFVLPQDICEHYRVL